MDQPQQTPAVSRKRQLVVCSSSSVSDLEKEATAVDNSEPDFVLTRKQRRKLKKRGGAASAAQEEEEKTTEVQEDVLVTPLATAVPLASSLEDLVLTPSSKWGGEGCDGGGGGS